MKLIDWLQKKKISMSAFAEMVGVNVGTVSRLCAGETVPTKETAGAIKTATKGKVTANDFYHD